MSIPELEDSHPCPNCCNAEVWWNSIANYENESWDLVWGVHQENRTLHKSTCIISDVVAKPNAKAFDSQEQLIVRQIRGYTNRQLLDEVYEQAGGDDYDGCFTERGMFEYTAVQCELERRLRKASVL